MARSFAVRLIPVQFVFALTCWLLGVSFKFWLMCAFSPAIFIRGKPVTILTYLAVCACVMCEVSLFYTFLAFLAPTILSRQSQTVQVGACAVLGVYLLLKLIEYRPWSVLWAGIMCWIFWKISASERAQVSSATGEVHTHDSSSSAPSGSAPSSGAIHTSEPLISLDPPDAISFEKYSSNRTAWLIISNNCDQRMAFKIYTTRPRLYGVKPAMGNIAPNGVAHIEIAHKGVEHAPDSIEDHKFKIEYGIVTQEDDSIKNARTVYSAKLRCKWVGDSALPSSKPTTRTTPATATPTRIATEAVSNEGSPRNSTSPDTTECIVCMQKPRDHAFVPCGHCCLCGDCSQRIKDFCPICRSPVENTIKIFF